MNLENRVYPEINKENDIESKENDIETKETDTETDTETNKQIEKYKEIEQELKDYKQLTEHNFQRFEKYQRDDIRCLALTKNNEQCLKPNCYYLDGHILCKYHRKKKYSPEYVIVYIHNYLEKKSDTHHIISYPYKNKIKYEADIELYKKELLDTKLESIIKLKQITQCKVCLEDFDNKDLLKCSNTSLEHQHFVCSDCLEGYINSQLLNDIGNNECMFNSSDKCEGIYNDAIIDKVIDKPETKEKWNELITITNIFKIANICDNYQICPLCRKWGCILDTTNADTINGNGIINNNTKLTIKCEQCHLSWCNTCKREAHGDDSCYKLKFKEDETSEKECEIIDKMIVDIISNTVTKKCSTCGCAYIKEEGCNLMTCHKCYGMTCYLCNSKIYYKEGKGKYWHFIGHDYSDQNAVCKLYNNNPGEGSVVEGNSIHIKKEIIKEIFNFISENEDIIGNIINTRLHILYEEDEDYKFIVEIIDEYIDNRKHNRYTEW